MAGIVQVFGMSLELLNEREKHDIPRIVHWAIAYLMAGERFKLEGIFRKVSIAQAAAFI
jgi:hypothetical protein